MAKYQFTREALNDLTEIWDYTVKEWSENQAEKYYNLVIASCIDLAIQNLENPMKSFH